VACCAIQASRGWFPETSGGGLSKVKGARSSPFPGFLEPCHPTPKNDKLAPCWKELFWETRKAFIAACAQVGTMEQMVRVRLREDMVLMARDAGHYRVANELLDSIAKEAGKMFVNRYTLALAAAPAPWARGTIIREYDDGTEVDQGDPGGPVVHLRLNGQKKTKNEEEDEDAEVASSLAGA
jgi:hypothetical protein